VRFTDRHGGVSGAPYATLNVATHVGDAPDAVAENRRRAVASMGAGPAPIGVWPHHVHGSTVLTVGEGVPLDGAGLDGAEADGVATRRPGVVLAAMGADCAPIALANDTAGAAIHVGWRGLVDGVVAAGVRAVAELGTGPVRAAIGPCICVRCYEFGADDLARVALAVGPEVVGATAAGTPGLDLAAGIRAALGRAGVEHVDTAGPCTAESPDHYSFRRDGTTGRQAVLVVLP
jgi:YfiH family protein